MENWEVDFYWLKIRHFIRKSFGTSSLPDLETVLFLIGVQELGTMQTEFSKEEKLELMHIGTATLFAQKGYFEKNGQDEKGWPIWKEKIILDLDEKSRQEKLKTLMIDYFGELPEEQQTDKT